MIASHTKLAAMALAATLLAGMSDSARSAENPAPADPSLLPVFHQFGDKAGLVALVEDFMTELVSDPRTRPFFADSDQKHIKAELVDQFCVILGGPCQYTGKSMTDAHTHMGIHESEFNALVEDLQVAMDKHSIPFSAQNKLLEKLAPMHRQVITRP